MSERRDDRRPNCVSVTDSMDLISVCHQMPISFEKAQNRKIKKPLLRVESTFTLPLTLNLYCVLLFRPCTVQIKFSPVYFG